MKAIFKTDIGKVRKQNEDAVYISDRLFAVADGMGGHQGGKEASQMALQVLCQTLHGKLPSKDVLGMAIETANRHLFEGQQQNKALSGMGTTLSVLWANDGYVYIGHVGDSRVYLLRGKELTQITQDHSLVAEMVKSGYITSEEALSHPYRNVITRAVGTGETISPDLLALPVQPFDKWLICSDGLHGLVAHDQIQAILLQNALDAAAEKLLQKALDLGGKDNISFIILDSGEVLP